MADSSDFEKQEKEVSFLNLEFRINFGFYSNFFNENFRYRPETIKDCLLTMRFTTIRSFIYRPELVKRLSHWK